MQISWVYLYFISIGSNNSKKVNKISFIHFNRIAKDNETKSSLDPDGLFYLVLIILILSMNVASILKRQVGKWGGE